MSFAHRVIPCLLLVLTMTAAPAARLSSQTTDRQTPEVTQCPGGTIDRFRLSGQVVQPRTLRLEDLQSLPPTQVTVSFLTGKGLQTVTYIGVPLWDLIQAAGGLRPNPDPTVKNGFLRQYVVVEGTDCYQVVLAVGEIEPNFEAKQVLVAYATQASPDASPQLLTTEGVFRLVVPGDQRGGRYVSNIKRIKILTAPALTSR